MPVPAVSTAGRWSEAAAAAPFRLLALKAATAGLAGRGGIQCSRGFAPGRCGFAALSNWPEAAQTCVFLPLPKTLDFSTSPSIAHVGRSKPFSLLPQIFKEGGHPLVPSLLPFYHRGSALHWPTQPTQQQQGPNPQPQALPCPRL